MNFTRLLKDKGEWGELATFTPNKRLPVYNWLYFKEGFSRDLVLNLLDRFDIQGQVMDPFCGTGTTLLAAKERGLDSFGIDGLPISVMASRVKSGDFDTDELRDAAAGVFERKFEKLDVKCPFRRYFNKHVLEDVVLFRDEVLGIEDVRIREFFLLGLVTSAIRASWVWKDGNVLKVKKHPSPPFRKFFHRRIRKMIKEKERFRGDGRALVKEGDPWDSGLPDESVAGVITSPPYLRQIDYSRVYSIEDWLIDSEGKMEAYLGDGAERRYERDMRKVLEEMIRVCVPGARAGIVIANAYFPKEERIVESDLQFAEWGEAAGFKAKEILVLTKRAALQRRTIRKGELRESIVVLKK